MAGNRVEVLKTGKRINAGVNKATLNAIANECCDALNRPWDSYSCENAIRRIRKALEGTYQIIVRKNDDSQIAVI